MPARQAGRKLEFKTRRRTSRQIDILYMHNRIRKDMKQQEIFKVRRQDKMRALKAYWHAKHKN